MWEGFSLVSGYLGFVWKEETLFREFRGNLRKEGKVSLLGLNFFPLKKNHL